MWLRDTWEQMDLLERFVADKVYIEPMLARTFRGHSMAGAIDVDTGKPRNWDEYVQKERVRRGVGLASGPSPVAPVNESIEDQIERIDALLNEKESPIDLRIYKTQIGCSVDLSVGGAEMEIETQIRGIDGVTTVRSIVDLKRPLTATSDYITYEIKFELMGSSSRKEYREAILFPGLRRVPGINIVDWSSIHRTNVRGTVRTVRENYLNGISTLDQMKTPRVSLEDAAKDWQEGKLKIYDVAMNTTDMRYHVMLPTEELWQYCNSNYRGDKRDFDGRYKHFVEKGPKAPVFVAIGQNGRIKVTGNEDLIWFARKSGKAEIPVFVSYQKQV